MEPWDWQLAVSQACRGRPGLRCQPGCDQRMAALKGPYEAYEDTAGAPAAEAGP